MSPRCNPSPLAVLGASARSLVQSAIRGGMATLAADRFVDADLLEACPSAIRIDDYPDGLVRAIRAFSGSAWCYVGGLENRPDLIERLAGVGPLAGSPASAARRVRDPDWLAARCSSAGCPMPETHRSPDGLPLDGRFLLKPLGRAGGHGIAAWRGGEPPPGPSIWQRLIAGAPCSAAFVTDRETTTLLMTTRQLIGWHPTRSGPSEMESFAWTGATTFDPGSPVADAVAMLGRCIAAEAGLVGLFGIDFLIDDRGAVVPIEVNPRPTASMELWDRATGSSHAAAHVAACGLDIIGMPVESAAVGRMPARVHGKAVLFAREPIRVSARTHSAWLRLRESYRDARGFSGVADIPAAGIAIGPGRPVLTVFADGETGDAVLASLSSRLAHAEAVVT